MEWKGERHQGGKGEEVLGEERDWARVLMPTQTGGRLRPSWTERGKNADRGCVWVCAETMPGQREGATRVLLFVEVRETLAVIPFPAPEAHPSSGYLLLVTSFLIPFTPNTRTQNEWADSANPGLDLRSQANHVPFELVSTSTSRVSYWTLHRPTSPG